MSSIRILIGPYIKSEQFRNTFIMFACPTELNMLTNMIPKESIVWLFEFKSAEQCNTRSRVLIYGKLSFINFVYLICNDLFVIFCD